MSFLRKLVGLGGVFQGLPGILVPGHMVFFAVVRGGNPVRVRGEIVELGGSLVHVFWHIFVSRTTSLILATRAFAIRTWFFSPGVFRCEAILGNPETFEYKDFTNVQKRTYTLHRFL